MRLSSIGDVIHTLPAYSALRNAWPSTHLGWAVEPAAAPLLRRIPNGPSVHVLDTHAWRRSFWRPESLRSMRGAINQLRVTNTFRGIGFWLNHPFFEKNFFGVVGRQSNEKPQKNLTAE